MVSTSKVELSTNYFFKRELSFRPFIEIKAHLR